MYPNSTPLRILLKDSIRVPLKVPLKASIKGSIGFGVEGSMVPK